MTENQLRSAVELRFTRAERKLKRFQALSFGAILVLTACVIYLAQQSRFQTRHSNNVLRVRGLIVEDAMGRERILIGAPVPAVSGRKRRDDTVGFIVVGENGADRVALAAPVPEPQTQGVVAKRIGNAAGLVLDDENGNERGGMGVLDNDGRVTLGLDYPNGTGEAITMAVLPGETSLQFHDTKTTIRAALLERNDAAPIMYGLSFRSPSTIDMGILRFNPYLVKHVVIEASDEALNKALDDMGQ